MLIETYDLEVFTPPCETEAERFSAIAHLATDLREVSPYLNATLRGAVYNPGAPALIWKKGGHNITFHPDRIAVSNVPDRDAAIHEVEGLVKRVNRTGEDNADAHVKRQIMGREVVVAVTNGRLDGFALLTRTFGTRERIFYGEFDGRPRKRVLVKIIGE